MAAHCVNLIVLWNASYFIASYGGITVWVLRKYIESQDRPDRQKWRCLLPS